MRHLNLEQLLDIAEGAADPTVVGHAGACERCGADIARLRSVLSSATDVGVPEPSPLFWEHLSARVRAAVASEETAAAPKPEPASGFFVRPSILRRPWAFAAAAGVAVLVIATAVSWRADAPPLSPASPGPQVAFGIQAAPGAAAAAVPSDDAPLDLLAALAADLDWDATTEAGLAISAGSVERAVAELTATERDELHRLLSVEMAGKVL